MQGESGVSVNAVGQRRSEPFDRGFFFGRQLFFLLRVN